jgi:hypothetical protein
VAESVVAWLTSTGFLVADRATVSAGSTVNESALLVTVLLLVSVTATLTENGDPVVVLGEQVMVAELDAVHPVGSPVHV